MAFLAFKEDLNDSLIGELDYDEELEDCPVDGGDDQEDDSSEEERPKRQDKESVEVKDQTVFPTGSSPSSKVESANCKEEAKDLPDLPAGTPTWCSSSKEEQLAADARSIHVGNVDYGATEQDVKDHFRQCGTINRVTIPCEPYTRHPKGFAFVEFSDRAGVRLAKISNKSVLCGRAITVTAKRTIANRPGIMATTQWAPRGGFRAAYQGRGDYHGQQPRGGSSRFNLIRATRVAPY